MVTLSYLAACTKSVRLGTAMLLLPQRNPVNVAIEVLHTLWCNDTSLFEGETFRLPECEKFPKAIQQPHPPVHIGGETDAALRRAARTAQGWHTFNRSPEELAAGLGKLDELLDGAGRSRKDLRITVCPYFNQLTPEVIEQYADAGADVLQTFDGLEARREAAAKTEGSTEVVTFRRTDLGPPELKG